ncbi:MAG: type II toxin-antitoxin system RelE/ParE family toxin [Candidatus Diapherotrites archaeon]|nr:type II toxin-antitoxin system RelE/ParE family toxin [Candidatus Diapherotrites archaeon]MDZ4256272.1 hypothetical protein [archaeon]
MVDSQLEYHLDRLRKGPFEDRRLADYIDKAFIDLKENPIGGIKVPKKLWPKEYVVKYRITNLFKYDLPNGWRLLYFLRGNDLEVLAIILEWLSHKDYERRFGY